MELKQYQIHRKYKKCEAKNQITIGNDFGVPDGKGDIAEILEKYGEFCVEEVHTEKGKIRIRGVFKVPILYLTERAARSLDSFVMEFPVDEILYMEDAASGDNLKIDWNLEDLKIHIIHPGKLSVKAVVNLYGEIASANTHMITETVECEEEKPTQMGNFVMVDPVLERRDSYRILDEITLPANKPNVSEVLWKDLQLRGLEISKGEGGLSLKGELYTSVLYEGEGEDAPIQWVEQTIPFHGNVEVAGMIFEMPGWIDVSIGHHNIEVKPDYDGELRMFQLEMLLELHLHLFEEKQCSYLIDAYDPKEQWKIQRELLHYEKVRMCGQTKCNIEGKEMVSEDGKILQIIGHHGELLNKEVKVTEDGILCEGLLQVQVLWVSNDDGKPFGSVVMRIPYRQLIEAAGIEKEDRYSLLEGIEQLSVSMVDGNHLEIHGRLKFEFCVLQRCSLQNITGIESYPYDEDAYRKMPGMKIHFVQQGESLWQIAKNQHTTIEEIKKCNELSAEEVHPGQKLLLVKTPKVPVLHL